MVVTRNKLVKHYYKHKKITMKTAMQEFVERNFYIDTEGEYHLKWTEDTPMNDELNEAFEKEKEQLEEARLKGYGEGYDEGIYDALNK